MPSYAGFDRTAAIGVCIFSRTLTFNEQTTTSMDSFNLGRASNILYTNFVRRYLAFAITILYSRSKGTLLDINGFSSMEAHRQPGRMPISSFSNNVISSYNVKHSSIDLSVAHATVSSG